LFYKNIYLKSTIAKNVYLFNQIKKKEK